MQLDLRLGYQNIFGQMQKTMVNVHYDNSDGISVMSQLTGRVSGEELTKALKNATDIEVIDWDITHRDIQDMMNILDKKGVDYIKSEFTEIVKNVLNIGKFNIEDVIKSMIDYNFSSFALKDISFLK